MSRNPSPSDYKKFYAALVIIAVLVTGTALLVLSTRTPPELAPVTIQRGESSDVLVKFTQDAIGSTGGELVVAKKDAFPGAWEGYRWEHLDNAGELKHYEVLQEGKGSGIHVRLKEVERKGSGAIGHIEVQVPDDAPAGIYKIFLEGTLFNYTEVNVGKSARVLKKETISKTAVKTGRKVTTAVIEVPVS